MALGTYRSDPTFAHDWVEFGSLEENPPYVKDRPAWAAYCAQHGGFAYVRDLAPRKNGWRDSEKANALEVELGRSYLTPEEAVQAFPLGCSRVVVEFEGAVLSTRERNGYHDSDFYAVVWNGERITTVEYATTRFPTYDNFAVVDATDEVKEAARKYLAGRRFEALKAHRDQTIAKWAEARSSHPRKGDQVVVVGGRKPAKGTTGVVFWIGKDQYTENTDRLGIELPSGETIWVTNRLVKIDGEYAPKVQPVDKVAAAADWHQVLMKEAFGQPTPPSDEQLLARAKAWSQRAPWHAEVPVPAGFVRL